MCYNTRQHEIILYEQVEKKKCSWMWWYAPVVPAQRKQRIIGSRLAGLLCKILFQREKEEKEVGGGTL